MTRTLDHLRIGSFLCLSASPYFLCRLVSLLALGEGWHNYHHTFPYDYSTSEWGFRINMTTGFIHAMKSLGWAYDLRSASLATVAARATRTGHPELTRAGLREAKKA